MDYKRFELRDRKVLIEVYQGTFGIEDILQLNENLLATISEAAEPLIILADISKATFPDIPHEMIGELFKAIDEQSNKTDGMKVALYTGNNKFEDFEKASIYARLSSNRPISMIPFNFLHAAVQWLGLNEEEQAEVNNLLAPHQ